MDSHNLQSKPQFFVKNLTNCSKKYIEICLNAQSISGIINLIGHTEQKEERSLSIMGTIDKFKAKAKSDIRTIVLPETEDQRTYQAAETVLKEGFANLVLVGSKEEVEKNGAGFDLKGAVIVDPRTSDKTDSYVKELARLRASKGMTEEKARELLLNDYLYYGVMMVKMEDADGMVAGACHSTAATLRPCLQILKTKPGTKLVSSFFIMSVPACEFGEDGTFVFADCALEQNPDAEKLAAIAISSAESFRALLGKEPKVAMLSHSTMGSAQHADIDKVVQATKIAKEQSPDLMIDGEMQLDAAIVPAIGKSKAPNSPVAGQANVLVFPDLDAANIGYKLVERLAKADAYGPMTQGIAKPVNDLSRGCSADDIVGVVAITAIQAQAE